MKNKIISALFVGVFMALCLSLSIGTLLFGPVDAVANETDLPEAPKLSAGADYLSQLQEYMNKRFFLRQELITMDRQMSAVMGVSGEPSVILGKDGWLFFEETLDDYTGVDPMTTRELFCAASNVALMEEYCNSQGKDFTFVLMPNKNSLYGQYMPNYGVKAKTTNAQRFHGLLSQMEVKYLDLFDAFGAQKEILYFAHDSHWNSKGAALGADLINQSFGVESSYFSGDFSYCVAHDGDLYAMVYPDKQDTEMNPMYTGALDYSFTGKATRPDSIRLSTKGRGTGHLLCYRDSFGELLFPYLADSYETALFSRSTNYDLTGQADYVAVELVERNLCYLIQNVPVMPSPVRQLELPMQSAGKAQAAVVTGAKAGQGLVQYKGTLPKAPDADTCVYVVCDGVAYEAFCLENDGFAVNVPEGAVAQYVVYNIGGVMQMFEIQ